MTHIAVQEALDGKNVIWMEKVTDEEYFAGSPVTEKNKTDRPYPTSIGESPTNQR
jgi:hypothetical protein